MKKTFALVPVVFLLAAAPVVADDLLFDNFESYANTSAMLLVWPADQNGVGVLVTNDPNTGNPGQSMFSDGGTVDDPRFIYPYMQPAHQRVFTATTPSDAAPLIFEFDFYDDGLSANKRISGGLRTDGGGEPLESILEIGMYNNVGNPEDPNLPLTGGYAIRHVFIGGDPTGNGGWLTFRTDDGVAAVEEGWHHFKTTIKASEILFELELDVDDPNDPNEISYASRLVTTSDGAQPYNVVRLGGPSNLWSQGDGADGRGGNFDNVRVYVGDSGVLLGDVETDGVLDWRDAEKFLGLMLDGPYQIEADMNEDGLVNGLDRQPFVDALRAANAGGAMAIPEPSTLVMLVAGMLLLAGVRLYPYRSG